MMISYRNSSTSFISFDVNPKLQTPIELFLEIEAK